MDWIRLSNKLLNDYRFNKLTDGQKIDYLRFALSFESKKYELDTNKNIGLFMEFGLYNDCENELPKCFEFHKKTDFKAEYMKTYRAKKKQQTEYIKPKKSTKKDNTPYQQIIDLYHQCLPNNPQVLQLTESRKRGIRALQEWDLDNLDAWMHYFNWVGKSRFLTGKIAPKNGEKRFIANIDFLLKLENAIKITEEKYHG